VGQGVPESVQCAEDDAGLVYPYWSHGRCDGSFRRCPIRAGEDPVTGYVTFLSTSITWETQTDRNLCATDPAQAAKYSGLLDCVTKIIRTEGPLTLYQGLESTIWRHVLWNAGYFGCIFQVRELLPLNPTKDKYIQMRNDLLSGAVGGTVGTILNTPMDVVKSRIQNSPVVAGGVRKYGWAVPSLGLVMREEGFGALYKGFLPKVLRLGPGGGILLVVFTGMMDFFRGMRGEA